MEKECKSIKSSGKYAKMVMQASGYSFWENRLTKLLILRVTEHIMCLRWVIG